MLTALTLGLRADEPQPSAIATAEKGMPVATIVIAEQPSRAAAFAALELQVHVEKVTGALLPVVNDAATVPGPRILVGESAATRALNLATDFKPQEYLIQFLPDTLVLMGRDAASRASMDFDEIGKLVRNESSGTHEGAALPGFFEDRGSLDAVHDFLERHCGVRWYAPGEIGLVCPELPTLAVRGEDIRRSPAMVYRWIVPTPLYMPTPADVVPPRKVDLWKLRMRLGGEPMRVNHSFEGYHARFFNEHPESYPEEVRKSPALNHQTKELAWGALGTKERMATFAALMAKARAAAETEVEKQRVALFEEGNWRPMLEGRANYEGQ